VSEQPPADGGQQQYPPPPGPFGPGQIPGGVGGLYGGASGPRASFGQRLGAMLLDSIILAVPGVILLVIGATSNSAALVVLAYIWWIVGTLLYQAILEGGPTGQTIGKRALNIRVIDKSTGGPIGFWRGLGRAAARIISGWPCYLGYLWMLWDSEKQTWHDKMTGVYVVPVSAYPVQ
jgi:uncharacterized RDD family membrane protein YckC